MTIFKIKTESKKTNTGGVSTYALRIQTCYRSFDIKMLIMEMKTIEEFNQYLNSYNDRLGNIGSIVSTSKIRFYKISISKFWLMKM